MFEPTSRYYSLATATYIDKDGKHHSYKLRRFLPQGGAMPVLAHLKLKEGERLDHLTLRTLGDPEQYWRICDANNVNHPRELTEERADDVRIPIPQA